MAQHRTGWPARIEAMCALALVIITAFYTCYARQQVSEMKEAVQVSRENTEAAKKSAEASVKAAEVAQAALASNERAFRIEQRPYLWVTEFAMQSPPQADQNLRVNVSYTNSGKTPATEMRRRDYCSLGEKGEHDFYGPPINFEKVEELGGPITCSGLQTV